jgi:hypothetical protein
MVGLGWLTIGRSPINEVFAPLDIVVVAKVRPSHLVRN